MAAILRTKVNGEWKEIPAIVGPKGDKGDKGDPGEVTQAEFNALSDSIGDVPSGQTVEGQISQLSSAIVDLDELKATKKELKEANRRIHLLEEASVGKLYTQETVSETSYQQDVPSGSLSNAVLGMWGGKSVAWNQQTDMSSPTHTCGSYTYNNGEYEFTITEKKTSPAQFGEIGTCSIVDGHKYYAVSEIMSEQDGTYTAYHGGVASIGNFTISEKNVWIRRSVIRTATITTDTGNFYFYPYGTSSADLTVVGDKFKFRNMFYFDLTQMFGTGNEPSTTDDPRIAEIEAYALAHPAYNAGEIVSADVDEIEAAGKNLFDDRLIGSGTSAGLSWSVNNHVVSVNGTASSAGWKTVYSFRLPVGTYHFHMDRGDGSPLGDFLKGYTSMSTDATVTVTDESTVFRIAIASTTAGQDYNGSFKNIIIEKGNSFTGFKPYKVTDYPIPSSVLSQYPLRSAGSVYDTITYEPQTVDGVTVPKWKHHKNVDVADFDSMSWNYGGIGTGFCAYANFPIAGNNSTPFVQLSNYTSIRFNAIATSPRLIALRDNSVVYYNNENDGTHPTGKINYVLPTEVVTDITELMQNWNSVLEVEEGGTITFKQVGDTIFAVPNTVNYLVKTTGGA